MGENNFKNFKDMRNNTTDDCSKIKKETNGRKGILLISNERLSAFLAKIVG